MNNQIWDATRDHVRVVLKDVEVDAHVGLHPWEQHRERPTRLLVTVELFAHLAAPSVKHDQANIMDYDRLRDHLKTWPSRAHTPLLETLAEELIEVAFANPQVEACRVSLVKPDIFSEAAGAGVEIYRVRPR